MAETSNRIGFRIDNGRLELMSILGVGAYGVVYLAKDVKTPSPTPLYYAVKCLSKLHLDQRQRAFQRREIALHTLAGRHPHVCTLHGVIECPTAVYVILDYLPGGDLFGCITERALYLGKDDFITSVFAQIVEAVDFCHQTGIFHRDLKPENILCSADGKRVVLADFGLATTDKTSTDFGCGSTFYMSPECQGGLFTRLGCYSTRHNDIWSLGVILVNLTCGRNPWKVASPSDETFQAYLHNPDFLRSILPISRECNELLKRIFCLNPQGRISLKELKEELRRIRKWTMNEDELRHATRATRDAARAWCPDVPDDAESTVPSEHEQQPGYGAVVHRGETDEETDFTETETEVDGDAAELAWYQGGRGGGAGGADGGSGGPPPSTSSGDASVAAAQQWGQHPQHHGQHQALYQQHAPIGVEGVAIVGNPRMDYDDPAEFVIDDEQGVVHLDDNQLPLDPRIVDNSPPVPPPPSAVVPSWSSPQVQPPTPTPGYTPTPKAPNTPHFAHTVPSTPSKLKNLRLNSSSPYHSSGSASSSNSSRRPREINEHTYSSLNGNSASSDASGSGSITRNGSNASFSDLEHEDDLARSNRDRKSSTSSAASSVSSTSSNAWAGLPPTPDVPRFAKNIATAVAHATAHTTNGKGKGRADVPPRQHHGGRAAGGMYDDDIELDLDYPDSDESIRPSKSYAHSHARPHLQPSPSVTSSKASFRANYAAYAAWADAIPPMPKLAQPPATSPRSDRERPRRGPAAQTNGGGQGTEYGIMEMARRAAQQLVGGHGPSSERRASPPQQQPVTISPLRQ